MENRKYRLLIIALYCYSGHVKSVIDHLKAVNPSAEITLLTNNTDDYRNIEARTGLKIERYDVPPVKIKWRWLMNAVIRHRQCQFFKQFSKGRRYDIVNVHFPNMFMSYVYPYLRIMSDKLVVTPWGSDILRRDEKYLKRLAPLYQHADFIATSPTTPLGKRIIENLPVKPDKVVGNFFGAEMVDYALKADGSVTTDKAKEHFGLLGRYVITCGYNRREPQRHKVMIAAIDQVRDRLPRNLTLLFPMQYGADTRSDYIDECRKECEERSLPALFVTDFLSVEELYLLRMATDMFIHVQTTDANSGSVMEYILCDKKIVHGSWMKYDDLEAFQPLFYYPVDRLEDLGDVIVNAYHSDQIDTPKGVLDFIKSCSWERKASAMNEFFLSII